MFDLGAFELLLIAVVAIIVIGPKDLPLAMRSAGRWAGKIRRVSNHFRSGMDAMIREAEQEDMEKQWQQKNDAIMQEHPDPDDMQAPVSAPPAASAEAATPEAKRADNADPQLPFPPP